MNLKKVKVIYKFDQNDEYILVFYIVMNKIL